MSRSITLLADGIRNTSATVANILPEEAIINWFPGHMAKASAQISHRINHCSHIIEIRDARVRHGFITYWSALTHGIVI